MEDAFARSVSEVLEFLGVDPSKGLTHSQVTEHARLYGRNGLRFTFRFRRGDLLPKRELREN